MHDYESTIASASDLEAEENRIFEVLQFAGFRGRHSREIAGATRQLATLWVLPKNGWSPVSVNIWVDFLDTGVQVILQRPANQNEVREEPQIKPERLVRRLVNEVSRRFENGHELICAFKFVPRDDSFGGLFPN